MSDASPSPDDRERTAPTPQQITQLLNDWSSGGRELVGVLFPLAYAVRRIAQAELRREQPGHTLNATALVHEAYLKLAAQGGVRPENRGHFLGIAARAMRTILIDHARARTAAKRGGGGPVVTLERVGELIPADTDEQLIALDDALQRLAEENSEAVRVVECRYFAGLNLDETAEVLGTSVATVRRRWAFARAWLQHELRGDSQP